MVQNFVHPQYGFSTYCISELLFLMLHSRRENMLDRFGVSVFWGGPSQIIVFGLPLKNHILSRE